MADTWRGQFLETLGGLGEKGSCHPNTETPVLHKQEHLINFRLQLALREVRDEIPDDEVFPAVVEASHQATASLPCKSDLQNLPKGLERIGTHLSTNVSPLIWMYVFRMMPASVGSANAMNDTDIVCRAWGLSVTGSTCPSSRMRTRENTQGYIQSVACRNKQTLDHLHAWTLRTCSGCGIPS